MRLRLENVSVSYRTPEGQVIPALAGVTLTIGAGEHLAVVGANGSGKSTLALCLAGLFQPTAGRIIVEDSSDRDASEDAGEGPRAAADRIRGAVVFQSPADNLIGASVLEEMMLTLEHRVAGDPDAASARVVLAEFGIAHLADQSLEDLSGGESQKVAVACAMASGRDLLILDEPTSHLDPPGRRAFFQYLESLSGEGSRPHAPTVVLITQYEDEARRFDRVVELNGGRVVYDGPGAAWPGAESVVGEPVERAPASDSENAPLVLRARLLCQVDVPGWPCPLSGLKEIDLEIRSGEAIGLCGPIGSGKTTLGFHLAGLFSAWDGVLEWPAGEKSDGKPVVMIQFPERQFFCPTVLEDVCYGPTARGLANDAAHRKGREALTAVRLDPTTFGHRSPFGLSGGQMRRAAMAGIAAVTSPLYILDEPTAALDCDGLQVLEALCRDWRDRGSAVVMISHDLQRLRTLTERVWVMNAGRIIFSGTWVELDGRPEVLDGIGF